MEREQLVNLLNILKTTTDKQIMLRGLHKIRAITNNNENIEQFRQAKGIPIMVRFLGKPKEEILEIALSIMANCCSQKICCEEAFEARIVVNLVVILKSIPNPVIQCRACRLLGNLAKIDAAKLLELNSTAIAKALCQIIQETSDVGTRVMAIRATRYLLSPQATTAATQTTTSTTAQQFLKHFLHSNGFSILLQLLTSIMKKSNQQPEEDDVVVEIEKLSSGLKKNQHREKYFEEVARSLETVRSDIFDREVLKHGEQQPLLYEMPLEKAALDLSFEIIKCLSIMSDMEMSLPVWNSLYQKGCNLSVIAFFATAQCKERSVSLRILANFSKNPTACYILSNSNAVTAACDLLLATDLERQLNESELRCCLNILGHLSVDACNRSKIRRSGAIRKLILMLKDSKSKTEISYILQLLNNFQYDNMSMELMLREGLITVLIRELYLYLTSDDEYHKKRREERQERAKKRKMREDAAEELSKSKVGRLSDSHVYDLESPSCSPRSNFSHGSPCSSRSMSPLYKMEGNNDEETQNAIGNDDDETYSPVCSEDEDDSNSAQEAPKENEATNDVMKLLDAISTKSADNTDDEKDEEETSQDLPALRQFGNMPRSTIDIIENLLFRITLLVNKRAELGKAETISTIIKAINAFGANNNFVNTLTNILLESQFFAQTVKHGVAHQLYQLTKKEETRTEAFAFLETLTCVGESNYGKAELVRLLRCEDNNLQKRAAIAVAYIIKNRKMLFQYLHEGNALQMLLEIILNASVEDQALDLETEAVDALTSLAQNTLNISVPHVIPAEREKEKSEQSNSSLENLLNLANLEADMRFILKENENAKPLLVEFNKQLLCDSSEVFFTMFNSSFRERNDNEVHLENYSLAGLKYFLKLILMGRGASEEQPDYEWPAQGKYRTLLEAYEMSRIYDLPPIEHAGLRMLIELLDESNCLAVLEWAMKNNHPELMECAINYYLSAKLAAQCKLKLFRSTNASSCAAVWLEMLTEAIFCRCQNVGL